MPSYDRRTERQDSAEPAKLDSGDTSGDKGDATRLDDKSLPSRESFKEEIQQERQRQADLAKEKLE